MLRLGLDGLETESEHERGIRDAEARAQAHPRWDTDGDAMEIDATLEALSLEPDHRVLELGAGRGRFTHVVAERCQLVVAVDISLESLLASARAARSGRVAYVEADATRDVVRERSVDRVLGTLASNLPTPAARAASCAAAARALTDAGVFVFSTHYYGLRARWDGEPREGRYTPGGIYRRLFTAAEVRREISPYFDQVRIRPICVVLPFARRLGLPVRPLDRQARRVPLVRALGTLLLVEARGPRR